MIKRANRHAATCAVQAPIGYGSYRSAEIRSAHTRDRVRSRAGLTLIEVMLAVAIMGIAGIALISAIGQGMAVVRGARLYSHAHTLLARVELEHPLFDDEIEVGMERGRFDDRELGQFEWQREIEFVGEEEDRLFLVTTRISWTRSGRRGYEEVAFYRYAPEEE